MIICFDNIILTKFKIFLQLFVSLLQQSLYSGANHCPGSLMFLFEKLDGNDVTKRYLFYNLQCCLCNRYLFLAPVGPYPNPAGQT